MLANFDICLILLSLQDIFRDANSKCLGCCGRSQRFLSEYTIFIGNRSRRISSCRRYRVEASPRQRPARKLLQWRFRLRNQSPSTLACSMAPKQVIFLKHSWERIDSRRSTRSSIILGSWLFIVSMMVSIRIARFTSIWLSHAPIVRVLMAVGLSYLLFSSSYS